MKKYYDPDAYDNLCVEITACCGIEEISDLSWDTNGVLMKVFDDSARRAMIIFHDAVHEGNGARLARKIRRLKLGKLYSTKQVVNPNTTNLIQAWVWIPNWNAMQMYCDQLEEGRSKRWD